MKKETKKILISGINGFLGSSLGLSLQNNYEIFGIKRKDSNLWRFKNQKYKINFIDLENIELFLKQNKIDCIIHTATNYGRNNANNTFSEIVNANIAFGVQLLELSIQNNIQSFINIDTMQNPLSSPYCLSKKHFREYLKYFNKKIKIINVKTEYIYGPKDDNNKFVYYLLDNFRENTNIALSKGEQLRDFIYINDAIDAFKIILQNLDSIKTNKIFELGGGTQMSIKTFCEKMLQQYNNLEKSHTKLLFGQKAYNNNENMNLKANIKPLQTLGFKPKVSINEGIEYIISDYLKMLRGGGFSNLVIYFYYKNSSTNFHNPKKLFQYKNNSHCKSLNPKFLVAA